MDLRGQLVALFRAVVEALSAERLVREACASGAAPRPAPGGRLVTLGLGKAAPEMLAGARALVLVDVPQGGPAAVSSGPFAADPTTFADAREIVRRRAVALPPRAARLLDGGDSEETLKRGDPADFVEHVVLCDMRAPAGQAG